MAKVKEVRIESEQRSGRTGFSGIFGISFIWVLVTQVC